MEFPPRIQNCMHNSSTGWQYSQLYNSYMNSLFTALRHLTVARTLSARAAPLPHGEQPLLSADSGLVQAAAALTAAHAAVSLGLDPHSLETHFAASWANVMMHGRFWTVLTSQLQDASLLHTLLCGVAFVGGAVRLRAHGAAMHPLGLVGLALASGASGATASVAHSVLAHAPPDALPVLFGRPPAEAAPHPGAVGDGREEWRAGMEARAQLRRSKFVAGPTAAVRDFHEYVFERDAQLRLGVVGGADLRKDIPRLVALYKPYKAWMEESVRASPAVGTAAALGVVGGVCTAAALAPAAPLAVGASAVALRGTVAYGIALSVGAVALHPVRAVVRRVDESVEKHVIAPSADATERGAVLGAGLATGILLSLAGTLLRRGR